MSRSNHDGPPQVAASILPWPAHKPAQGSDNAIFAVVNGMPADDLAPTARLCIERLADTDRPDMHRKLLTTAGAAVMRLLDLVDAGTDQPTEGREP